ncbi:16S rRNA (uracil(1498)-N(3))-methyltransferase [Agaribacterium haliotis]|uniref:16S rRNA (uracil(1498)-N(3))-methyltransferase n=1 Tax=Agaribacterium haliotis TaxID=2013869 RepID=UPI000BB54457|nr:16S rRNA (uracil(1498)-N(3))-methyltransferase [Agaribacterium haliotis]
MNTLILEQHQFINDTRCVLNARQQQHIKQVLKSQIGESLQVAKLNGLMGTAQLVGDEHGLALEHIELKQNPPKQLPVSLVLALPRPQMLKRILQTVACFGVKELHLIQSRRVEKSFWQSPSASDDAIYEQLILGLEQAKASQLPKVSKHRRFREFAEDLCPELCRNKQALVAHPGPYPMFAFEHCEAEKVIAIGPEGGFNDFEIALFLKAGFTARQLGPRILKVETAVTTLLARCL